MLRNMVIEAVISKRNMVTAIVYKGFGGFVFTKDTKPHAVIKYRSEAYDLI